MKESTAAEVLKDLRRRFKKPSERAESSVRDANVAIPINAPAAPDVFADLLSYARTERNSRRPSTR